MKTIKKLLNLLLPHERKRLILLLAMMIVMAVLEMIGVVSIMPFMAVLANSEIIETNDTNKRDHLFHHIMISIYLWYT